MGGGGGFSHLGSKYIVALEAFVWNGCVVQPESVALGTFAMGRTTLLLPHQISAAIAATVWHLHAVRLDTGATASTHRPARS